METVSVPKEALVTHLVEMALENGIDEEYVDVPRHGDYEVEYSLNDVDDWTIDIEDGEIVCFGTTEARYQVQTRSATYNPPSKAHPAEYKWEYMDVGIEIRTVWADHGFGVRVRVEVM